jgi:hypothetical protein
MTVMPEDPVVKSGRREALFTLVMWLAAVIYTVGYCTLHGYGPRPHDEHFVLWFPSWVFWGIVAPWLVCAIVSSLFALFVMQDAPLASDADAPPDDNAAGDNADGDSSDGDSSDDDGSRPGGNSPQPSAPAPGRRS